MEQKLTCVYIREPKTDSKTVFALVLLACMSCVLTYFSYTYDSLNMECLILGLGILFLNYGNPRFVSVVPMMLFSVATMAMLVLNGRFWERNFNAPILHVYKFSNLFFAGALSLSMGEMNKNQKALVVKVVLGVTVLSCLLSLYYAIRIDNSLLRHSRGYRLVAGFNQTYAVPFFIAILLLFFRMAKQTTIQKLACLFVILVFMYFIFVASFTAAFMLTGMGIGVAFLLTTKGSKWKIIIPLLICLVLIYIFRTQISDFIYEKTANLQAEFRQRIRYLADQLFGTTHNNEGYEHERRDELIQVSMDSFKANLLFGVGYSGFGFSTVGFHHEWVDMLATFGLIGNALFALAFAAMAVPIYREALTVMDRWCYCVSMLLMIILGFLNPCFSLPVLIAVFVVAPNMSCLAPGIIETEKVPASPSCIYFRN